jgi:hypothetical protein
MGCLALQNLTAKGRVTAWAHCEHAQLCSHLTVEELKTLRTSQRLSTLRGIPSTGERVLAVQRPGQLDGARIYENDQLRPRRLLQDRQAMGTLRL